MKSSFLLLCLSLSIIWPSQATTHLDSNTGREIVRSLQHSLKSKDTTSCRKEQKAVVDQKLWSEIQHIFLHPKKSGFFQYQAPSITLESRDKLPPGGANGTFTFYGEGIKFMNQGVSTKIRMRVRFYLALFEKDGEIIVERSSKTKDRGFLEIKIKNPTPDLIESVNKYRMVILDEDIAKLFSLKANSKKDFKKVIEEIKKRTLSLPENQEHLELIEEMFSTFTKLAPNYPDFIKPTFAISYERRGFSYTEQSYPIPRSLRKQHKLPSKMKNVEYQFTIDKNIKAYIPYEHFSRDFEKNSSSFLQEYMQKQLRLSSGRTLEKMSLQHDEQDHEQDEHYDLVAEYPSGSVAIEFKDPLPMANFPHKEKSHLHQHFLETVVGNMHSSKNLKPFFRKNKGKASHFKDYMGAHFQALPLIAEEAILPFHSLYLQTSDMLSAINLGLKPIGVKPFVKKATAKLLIHFNGDILFLQKKNKHDSSSSGPKELIDLEFIGGKVQEGETPFDALKREVAEEDPTGLLKDLLTIKPLILMANWQEQHFIFNLTLDKKDIKIFLEKIKETSFTDKHEHSRFVMMNKETVMRELRGRPEMFTKKTQLFLKHLLSK
jgi:hypothetical protein